MLSSALGGGALKGLITVNQAATLLEVTPARIRQMLAEGKLKATRVGRFWIINPASLRREMGKREHPSA